ncbi:hypothetical protein K431DRAFT_348300 [Polychaeton citri CBS 116435]|uniref:Uncharacterized protein n=1 Tax=Polychaeton citri CBS 116435 TaxID=1314669 RepID=A0A9P4Q6L8_9PEZI|nr:hypothetical protein K431DRAFT_348300 [Polychaeton citri CBS 116435]
MGLGKSLGKSVAKAMEDNTWKKLASPSATRGKTVHPKTSAEQETLGTRWDYDGEITKADGVYHKYQLQANAGKVPSSIKHWQKLTEALTLSWRLATLRRTVRKKTSRKVSMIPPIL